MKAEILAERILIAAGSGLRHYTERSRKEIVKAASDAIKAVKQDKRREARND